MAVWFILPVMRVWEVFHSVNPGVCPKNSKDDSNAIEEHEGTECRKMQVHRTENYHPAQKHGKAAGITTFESAFPAFDLSVNDDATSAQEKLLSCQRKQRG